MLEFFSKLLDVSDFPARWHCGRWTPSHGWMHIIADLIVFACYLAIPVALLTVKRKRRDIPVPWALTLFAVFIVSCGFVHLIEAIIFYRPVYRLSGVVKTITAIASLATVGYLIPIVPKLFALRSPRELESEIEQRKVAEAKLLALQHDLERQVEERSRELLAERERLKHALERLTESEELLSAALNAAPNAMAMVSREGSIKLHNNAFCDLFGYSSDQVQTLQVEQLLPAEARQRHGDHRAKFLKDPSPRPMGADQVLRGLHRSGRAIPLEIGLNPVEVHGDSFTLVAIVDISERLRAREAIQARENRLQRTNQELSEFVYAASHDLQEPLRKVTAFCQLLEREAYDQLNDRSREYIRFAVDGAQRMQCLIRDLLDYSRIAQAEHDWVEVSVQDIVEETLEGLSVAIEEAGALVQVAKLPVVRSRPVLLRQIFANLVGNALKYRHAERAPVIDVHCERQSDEWLFTVSDNGIGIPRDQRDRVFRLFQRLHRKEEYAGTGIGLSVVKKAVERCGGRIWIEDSKRGGAAFSFTVPAEQPANT